MLLVCVYSLTYTIFSELFFLFVLKHLLLFFFYFFTKKFKTSTFHNTTRVLETHHFNKSFFLSLNFPSLFFSPAQLAAISSVGSVVLFSNWNFNYF